MTILLSTLAVAFAAFCVWLTVRIINRRERWAKWTAGAVVALLPSVYMTGSYMRGVPPNEEEEATAIMLAAIVLALFGAGCWSWAFLIRSRLR